MITHLNTVVNVDADTISACWTHANDLADARAEAWTARGAFKLCDVFNGKLGEFAVYQLARSVGEDVALPDIAIGRVHRRFEPDVPILAEDGGASCEGFSVKATTFLSDKSWVFQVEPEDHFSLGECPDDERRLGALVSFRGLPDGFVPVGGHDVTIDWIIELPIPQYLREPLRNGFTNKTAVYDSTLQSQSAGLLV